MSQQRQGNPAVKLSAFDTPAPRETAARRKSRMHRLATDSAFIAIAPRQSEYKDGA